MAKRGRKRVYPDGWESFRRMVNPIVTAIKRLPDEERVSYMAFLKPYYTDEEYKHIILHLRGRKLL